VFTSTNPATDKLVQTYPALTPAELEAQLESTYVAWRQWRKSSFDQRAQMLRSLAALLRAQRETHARVMSDEMGKVRAEALAEVDKCAWVCEYYAEQGPAMLADEPVDVGMTESLITYRPIGPVLAIMPWNFPYWQALRFAAPYLMAGNAVLLKHAPRTMGCAMQIQSLFAQAGLPKDVFCSLLVEEAEVPKLIADDRIAAVSMTGSEAGGRAIGQMAGRALKKAVLELGGSDPYIILEDADLSLAVPACVQARMLNAGQSCIAAKRFVVHQDVHAEFSEALIEAMRARRFGDPQDPAVHLGPMARHDLRTGLHQQVQSSVEKGAKIALGGQLPQGPGSFYPPTVLLDVPTAGLPAADEELFGPVASVIRVRDEAEAIAVANRTRFGLGAAVFTQDLERGRRIATHEIESGACFVNDFVRSDPRLPFGGVKASGHGRELGLAGIRELVNVKTVCVR